MTNHLHVKNALQLPEIPRKVTIQSLAAMVLLLSGVALTFAAMYLPPIGIIDSSVIIVFGQILIAVGTLIGVDMRYMVKIYLAYLQALAHTNQLSNINPLSDNEEIPSTPGIGAEQAGATSEESE
jgi:hypothetical protein